MIRAAFFNDDFQAFQGKGPSLRRTLHLALQLGVFVLLISYLLPFVGQSLPAFTEQYLEAAARKHGPAARERMRSWQNLINNNRNIPEQEKLRVANDFWNRIPYRTDMDLWRVNDYWATPAEMLAVNGGDCEDYAIGKYFTLIAMGVDKNRLKITYVMADIGAHMVLAYYPAPNAIPLILDNLLPTIRTADRRPDLRPVYAFNGDGMWLIKGGTESRVGTPSNIRFWRQLLDRMGNEFK